MTEHDEASFLMTFSKNLGAAVAELNRLNRENATLREALTEMVYEYAPDVRDSAGSFCHWTTNGDVTLRAAFKALGWEDPHEVTV